MGDLLREKEPNWRIRSPAWRDYGIGIITHLDVKNHIAQIYWFEVGVSSFYKFRNMQMFLAPVSQPR